MVRQNNRSVGTVGEDLAMAYLESLGYVFVCKNFRCTIGEIDLIMRDEETLVFIEVKLRRTNNFGHPFEAVNLKKQNKIRRVALHYLNMKIESDIRFDVVGISGKEQYIEHIKNAF